MVTESYQDIHLEQPLTGFWQHLGNLLQRVGRVIIRWDRDPFVDERYRSSEKR